MGLIPAVVCNEILTASKKTKIGNRKEKERVGYSPTNNFNAGEKNMKRNASYSGLSHATPAAHDFATAVKAFTHFF